MALVRLIAIIGVVTLITRLVSTTLTELEAGGGLITALVRLFWFFTIWTNLLVTIVFTRASLAGRMPSASLSGALTVYIAVVGIIYHLLLAQDFPIGSLEFWIDHSLHTVVPILVVVYWAISAPKAALRWSDPARWLIYPVGYLIYILVRGTVTGAYPYPFTDVATLGYAQALMNCTGVAALFYVLGLMLVALSRVLPARNQATRL